IARLGENAHQRFLVKRVERGDDRQAADKLRDHAELDEIVAGHLAEQLAQAGFAVFRIAAETDGLAAHTASDDVIESDAGAAADDQDVAGVDLDVLLLGVLAAALWRDVADGPLEHFQQGLLDALAADIAGDADVLAGLGDLVHLVDVDDAALGRL